MVNQLPDSDVTNRLIHWAAVQEKIRAMLLFGSRANPAASVDRFSDYDILLAVSDIHPYHSDDRWLEDFGEVLVVFRNPIGLDHGFESFGFITHYLDGSKIDFCFYPVDYLRWAAQQIRLPDDLDHGYRILVDKDHLAEALQLPTYTAYLPHRPTEADYRAIIEEFFNDALYVGKHLWRGNLFPVKLSLDHIMKYSCLRKMLEWRMDIDRNWSFKSGAGGKGLKKQVDPALWAELGQTYVGPGLAENWDALFKTIALFRKVANEVAGGLGYQYPSAIDQEVTAALQRVKELSNYNGSL
jgi:aminoglycoside 6-adenylyltransferase